MRICIINTFYKPNIVGGAEVCVIKLAETLKKLGHDVYVISTGEKNDFSIIDNIKVYRIKVKNVYSPLSIKNNYKKTNKIKLKFYKILDMYNIGNYFEVRNILKKINPEVVHVNNLYGFSISIWSAIMSLNIPIVQTVHDYGLLEADNKIIRLIKSKFNSICSKNINVVTAPSQFTLDKFKENKFFEKSYLEVVPNGINYSVERINKILENKKSNILNKKIINFVFLGRLEEIKGILYLIDIFKNNNKKNIRLTIAGTGTLENKIKELISNDNRIRYIGFISEEEIENLLIMSDVLIIPSLWDEPFGMVILEAYKFLLPVIGSDKGGINEVINHGKTGFVFNPKNNNELNDYINYFSHGENILKMMDNCEEEIKKFDLYKQCKKFLNIYYSLINQEME